MLPALLALFHYLLRFYLDKGVDALQNLGDLLWMR